MENKKEMTDEQKAQEKRIKTELETSDVNVRNPNDLLPGETEEERTARLGKEVAPNKNMPKKAGGNEW